jgi:transposase
MDDEADTRECPLCGGTMHFKASERITQVPGNPSPSITTNREFLCPDCDYFEDADEEG